MKTILTLMTLLISLILPQNHSTASKVGFRFYSKINAPAYSTSNRGRVCIGDMKIYLEG